LWQAIEREAADAEHAVLCGGHIHAVTGTLPCGRRIPLLFAPVHCPLITGDTARELGIVEQMFLNDTAGERSGQGWAGP
jgi:hypothetical protein